MGIFDGVGAGIGLSAKPDSYANLFIAGLKNKHDEQAAQAKRDAGTQRAVDKYGKMFLPSKDMYAPYADMMREEGSIGMQKFNDSMKQDPNNEAYYVNQYLEPMAARVAAIKNTNDSWKKIENTPANMRTQGENDVFNNVILPSKDKYDLVNKIGEYQKQGGDPTGNFGVTGEYFAPQHNVALEARLGDLPTIASGILKKHLDAYQKSYQTITENPQQDKEVWRKLSRALPQTEDDANAITNQLKAKGIIDQDAPSVPSMEGIHKHHWDFDHQLKAEYSDRLYQDARANHWDAATTEQKAKDAFMSHLNMYNQPREQNSILNQYHAPQPKSNGQDGDTKNYTVTPQNQDLNHTYVKVIQDDKGNFAPELTQDGKQQKGTNETINTATVTLKAPITAKLNFSRMYNTGTGRWEKNTEKRDITIEQLHSVPFASDESRIASNDETKKFPEQLHNKWMVPIEIHKKDANGKSIVETRLIEAGEGVNKILTEKNINIADENGDHIDIGSPSTQKSATGRFVDAAHTAKPTTAAPAAAPKTIKDYDTQTQSKIQNFMKVNKLSESDALLKLRDKKLIQ